MIFLPVFTFYFLLDFVRIFKEFQTFCLQGVKNAQETNLPQL